MRYRDPGAACTMRIAANAVFAVLLVVLSTVVVNVWSAEGPPRAVHVLLAHAILATAWTTLTRSPLGGAVYAAWVLDDSRLWEPTWLAAPLAAALALLSLARGGFGPFCEAAYRLDAVVLAIAAYAEAFAAAPSCLDVARPIVAVGVIMRNYAVPRPLLWVAAAGGSHSWPLLLLAMALVAASPLAVGRHPLFEGVVGVYGRWSGSRLILSPRPFEWRGWGFACAVLRRRQRPETTVVYVSTRNPLAAVKCLGVNEGTVACVGCEGAAWSSEGFEVVEPASVHPALAEAGHRALPALAARLPSGEVLIIDVTALYPTQGFWEAVASTARIASTKARLVVLLLPSLPRAAPTPPASRVIEARCCTPLMEDYPRLLHPRLILKLNDLVASGRALLALDTQYYLVPCKARSA